MRADNPDILCEGARLLHSWDRVKLRQGSAAPGPGAAGSEVLAPRESPRDDRSRGKGKQDVNTGWYPVCGLGTALGRALTGTTLRRCPARTLLFDAVLHEILSYSSTLSCTKVVDRKRGVRIAPVAGSGDTAACTSDVSCFRVPGIHVPAFREGREVLNNREKLRETCCMLMVSSCQGEGINEGCANGKRTDRTTST